MLIPLFYNEPVNFRIEFTAPVNDGYTSALIVDDTLHEGLTFNASNSSIKSNGSIISGSYFSYDAVTNLVTAYIPSMVAVTNVTIDIVLATNVTNTTAIINSNYVIYNTSYVKLKDYPQLITASLPVTVEFTEKNYIINATPKVQTVPAIINQEIYLDASFSDSNSSGTRVFTVTNDIGNYLTLVPSKCYVRIGVQDVMGATLTQSGSVVTITIPSTTQTKGNYIQVRIATKIASTAGIPDSITNSFTLAGTGIITNTDSTTIKFVKAIAQLVKILL